MKFFVDGADIQEIEELMAMGLVDGVTTNPSIIAKTGRPMEEVLRDICKLVPGPVSAEVISEDTEGMLREAKILNKIAPNIAIKVPLTQAGLVACHRLSEQKVMVNVTLCFSPAQALLAAKAGATFVSPFVGRLDDIGYDGMELVQSIVMMYDNDPMIQTQVLAASLRGPRHVVVAAELGAHVGTAPASVFKKMLTHPLTDQGIQTFMADWKKSGLSI